MTDETSTALRERPDRKRGRQPLSRRFCLSMDRARSLWRNTLGYLDGAFERRQSAHAGAAERALLQLNDYTLRDIGVKRCDLLAMACGLSREDLVLEDGDGQGSISLDYPVETTALPVSRRVPPAREGGSFWRGSPAASHGHDRVTPC